MIPALANVPHTRRAYDHRIREQVVRNGARALCRRVTIPRSTVATWQRRGLRPVVTVEPVDPDRQQLLDTIDRLDRRARILAAAVRLLLALLRASGFRLAGQRLPDGAAKAGILRAISSAGSYLPLPLPLILRIVHLDPARYHAWRRAAVACALDDRTSCPHTSPGKLTAAEVATVKEMVLAPEYRHMPLNSLFQLDHRSLLAFAEASVVVFEQLGLGGRCSSVGRIPRRRAQYEDAAFSIPWADT